jgi:hypothetical protein
MFNNIMRAIANILILILLFTLNSIAYSQEIIGNFSRQSDEEVLTDVSKTRKLFENYPSEILGLKPPVKVLAADMILDGGTKFIVIIDSEGKEFKSCMDFRIGTKTYSQTYLNAKHPTDETSKAVKMGGEEEKALYSLLIDWAKSHPRPKEDDIFNNSENDYNKYKYLFDEICSPSEAKEICKDLGISFDNYIIEYAHEYLANLDRRFYYYTSTSN